MRVEISEDRPIVEVVLSDGSTAALSPLIPDDRQYLTQGMDELSLESRFARFGQGRHGLTETEWRYLTDIDQVNHVAWVAMIDGEGAGVGRYIRPPDREECAEVAVTILDPHQRRGLGTALFLALVAVARNDGVPAFCFGVVPTNHRVREILHSLRADLAEVAGLMEGRLPLGDQIEVPDEAAILEAMRQVRGS